MMGCVGGAEQKGREGEKEQRERGRERDRERKEGERSKRTKAKAGFCFFPSLVSRSRSHSRARSRSFLSSRSIAYEWTLLHMGRHCCTCVDRKVQSGCAISSHWILLQTHPAHPLHTLPFFVPSVSLPSRGWSYDAFPYFGPKKKARFQHILVCLSGARCWCCVCMYVLTHKKNPHPTAQGQAKH